jgi:hypothetical protein
MTSRKHATDLIWKDKNIEYGQKVVKVVVRMGLEWNEDFVFRVWAVMGGKWAILSIYGKSNFRTVIRKIRGGRAESLATIRRSKH